MTTVTIKASAAATELCGHGACGPGAVHARPAARPGADATADSRVATWHCTRFGTRACPTVSQSTKGHLLGRGKAPACGACRVGTIVRQASGATISCQSRKKKQGNFCNAVTPSDPVSAMTGYVLPLPSEERAAKPST
jgi:hypothetical protein